MLYRQKVLKDGKTYMDLYLIWSHNDKAYKVRIEPRFLNDKVLLISHAKDMEPLEVVK